MKLGSQNKKPHKPSSEDEKFCSNKRNSLVHGSRQDKKQKLYRATLNSYLILIKIIS